MRIVHVIPTLSQEASGPSYSVINLCKSILATGNQITLATLDCGHIAGAPSFVKAFPRGIGSSRLGRSPAMHRWLSLRCEANEVDILHNHGMWQMNSVYPAWAAHRGDVQFVCSPRGALSEWAMRHGSKAKKIFWPIFQLPALKRVSCFHATAESEYEDIRRLGFRQPVAIIPNGIDLPVLQNRVPSQQRTLLFLGRIHVVKGLDMLLPAWHAVQLEFPEWRLVIAGSDDVGYRGSSGYLEEIKAKVRQLGLERVQFPGPLYGAQKRQAYRDADLYVLPSYSENFGMTVAEALSMGTPAVVSKGAPWEGLNQNDAGWWVEKNSESLAVSLREAMRRSPAELCTMGERGRAWMQRDFSWSGIGAKMIATYGWLGDRSLPMPEWVRLA